MGDYANEFLSTLYREHLKARGYKKVRHTFSRPVGSYIERIQFQGSSWNGGADAWRFYINFGVEFADLPKRVPSRDFPATHCWTRIEHLVSDAPKHYDLTAASASEIATDVARHIEGASLRAKQQIKEVRSNYEKRHSPRLTTRA